MSRYLPAQLAAELLAEIYIDGVVSVDTALEARAAGVDLGSLIELGSMAATEAERLLEDRDEPVFDMTPAGRDFIDDTTH